LTEVSKGASPSSAWDLNFRTVHPPDPLDPTSALAAGNPSGLAANPSPTISLPEATRAGLPRVTSGGQCCDDSSRATLEEQGPWIPEMEPGREDIPSDRVTLEPVESLPENDSSIDFRLASVARAGGSGGIYPGALAKIPPNPASPWRAIPGIPSTKATSPDSMGWWATEPRPAIA
jgi:hypothetical protein